jgi:hypothetical protein
MKVKIQLGLGLLVLATGCASHKSEIVFSDDAEILSASTKAVTLPPQQKKLERADELKIEQLVFSYLLERHFWDLADYSAVFLSADDALVATLMKKYPDHNPPIKQSFHAYLPSNRTPVDKDTNQPAMVLSVDVNEPNADDSVEALGRWYAGGAVAGFRTFNLKKVDGDWQVVTVK